MVVEKITLRVKADEVNRRVMASAEGESEAGASLAAGFHWNTSTKSQTLSKRLAVTLS